MFFLNCSGIVKLTCVSSFNSVHLSLCIIVERDLALGVAINNAPLSPQELYKLHLTYEVESLDAHKALYSQ